MTVIEKEVESQRKRLEHHKNTLEEIGFPHDSLFGEFSLKEFQKKGYIKWHAPVFCTWGLFGIARKRVLFGNSSDFWKFMSLGASYVLMSILLRLRQAPFEAKAYESAAELIPSLSTLLATDRLKEAEMVVDYAIRNRITDSSIVNNKGRLGKAVSFLIGLVLHRAGRREDFDQFAKIQDMGRFRAIFDDWDSDERLETSARILLDWRLEEMEMPHTMRITREVFSSECQLIPFEYEAFNAVRRQLGKSEVRFPDHPYLQGNPYAIPAPGPVEPLPDPFLEKIREVYLAGFDMDARWQELYKHPFFIPEPPDPKPERTPPAKLKQIVLNRKFLDGEIPYDAPQLFIFDWRDSEVEAFDTLALDLPELQFFMSPIEGETRKFQVSLLGKAILLELPLLADQRQGSSAHDVIWKLAQDFLPEYEVRQFKGSLQCDTPISLLMPSSWWRELDAEEPAKTAKVFVPILSLDESMSYKPVRKKRKAT
ncbi:MAG: hypothetical protein SF028_02155 [Candidatus Sumerlaeia bacterium]|nr:hypothetical protein [Candidatus Sumerlaeia bacterium]